MHVFPLNLNDRRNIKQNNCLMKVIGTRKVNEYNFKLKRHKTRVVHHYRSKGIKTVNRLFLQIDINWKYNAVITGIPGRLNTGIIRSIRRLIKFPCVYS